MKRCRIYKANRTLHCVTTDWFPWFIKPVHRGMYIVGSDMLHVMLYWDGNYWIRGDKTLADDQDMCWCGWTGEYYEA